MWGLLFLLLLKWQLVPTKCSRLVVEVLQLMLAGHKQELLKTTTLHSVHVLPNRYSTRYSVVVVVQCCCGGGGTARGRGGLAD